VPIPIEKINVKEEESEEEFHPMIGKC